MKQIISISILFSILLSSLGQSVLFVHYLINKDYYATVLCENKAKPMVHCNGKCHLKKELKEQEKKEQSPSSPIKEKQENNQFFQSSLQFSISVVVEKKKYNCFYLLGKTESFIPIVFHPPLV